MRSLGTTYLIVGAILAAFVWMLAEVVTGTSGNSRFGQTPQALIQPRQ